VISALEPLNTLADSRGLTRDYYKQAFYEGCCYEGRLFALPSTPGVIALHYNKRIFHEKAYALRAAGLDPDRAPRSIAELDRYAQVLDSHDKNGQLVSAGYLPQEPVLDEILRRLPVSLELAVLAMFFGLLIAVPTGIFSAVRQDTWLDYLFRTGAVGGLSVPGFWMATIVIVSASIWWQWVPPMRYTPLARDPVKNLSQLLLPAIILGLALSASVMRMTRSMVLEVLREDYVRTAWAKGLPESRVIARHVLKNAMIPVVTVMGLQLSALLGGTVIMESIFVIPGMGKFLLDAITWRDYPVIQGINLFLATSVIVLNLVIDVVYGFLDPRIRFG
jgi:peptide/nickel transport system permease protein